MPLSSEGQSVGNGPVAQPREGGGTGFLSFPAAHEDTRAGQVARDGPTLELGTPAGRTEL